MLPKLSQLLSTMPVSPTPRYIFPVPYFRNDNQEILRESGTRIYL